MRQLSGSGTLLLTAAGFGLWAAAFVTLYAMLSVGCALGWQDVDVAFGLTLQRLQLLLLLAVFLAAHGALLLWLRRLSREAAVPSGTMTFVRRVAFLGALAALAASAFTFMGIGALTAC